MIKKTCLLEGLCCPNCPPVQRTPDRLRPLPAVNEFRLYMETMDRILPSVKKILLGSRVKVNNAEPATTTLLRRQPASPSPRRVLPQNIIYKPIT
jgi:hypothetical protein